MIAADLTAAQANEAANRREHDSAASLAGRAVTLNPLKKDYLILKAKSYERAAEAQGTAEDYALAVEAYRTLLNRFGPDSFYTLKLAQAKAKLAQAQGIPIAVAFPDLERAVELDRFNLPLREFVADFYEREGFAGLGFNHRIAIHCWAEGCDISGRPE